MDDGLHAAGFLSYELGYAFEPSLHALMPKNRQVPLIWMALFPKNRIISGPELTDWFASQINETHAATLENTRPALSKDNYLKRFAKVKQFIASGDIYQVNLTFKLLFDYRGSPIDLYATLRNRQPVSYGALLETKDFSVLSHSPELFFEIKQDIITTRPMKGTIKRGSTRKKDQNFARQLAADPKNRAENLMIVDLMRNDFARICEVGSVEVSDLYQVSAYPTLHQMTSDVQGRLRPGTPLLEIMKALIPAGSITGAPKIRAQEIISDLEETPRGLYCGAMGMLSRSASTGQIEALFNVAIRTLTLFPDGCGETGIGSGVVQDSNGQDEYDECLLKAKFLTMPDFKLIETMRLDPDESYFLREQHLARLQRTSKEFGFLLPLEEIRKALHDKSKALKKGVYLVRLLLSIDGQFDLTSTPIDPPAPDKTILFTLSDKRVDSADHLLGFKTTRRKLFDEEWARANKQLGTQEILFLNERDELTEGARSNLFIEHNGQFLTPPLSCGLLPGTLREHLLNEGRVVETVLTQRHLDGAKIYFGNSVRGLQPAKLVEP